MHFWVKNWMHSVPGKDFDAEGKRVIVSHSCFGPLETRSWYEMRDGRYCRRICMIEGIQTGDVFTDLISRDEMRRVLEQETALCRKYGKSDMAALFQMEKDRLSHPV